MLEPGFIYEFGELKAGDRFAWQGGEYEKISGNCAIYIFTDSVVEFDSGIFVHLYEVG